MRNTFSGLGNEPFFLKPAGKDYLWGGVRLREDFAKEIDMMPLAETWECSTHPDGESTVASGVNQGRRLSEVLAEHPEYIGTHPRQNLSQGNQRDESGSTADSSDTDMHAPQIQTVSQGDAAADSSDAAAGENISSARMPYCQPETVTDTAMETATDTTTDMSAGEIPIIVKFIDAAGDLSIQVHPDDEYAARYENGQRGKTEVWYVVDAAKDAELIYGFMRDIDRETLLKAVENGTVEKLLQHVPVRKGDVFFIESGTVHAIGKGCLVVEAQESSNLTYRLYDYNRTDKNGNRRQLHLEKALQVANMKASSRPRQPMHVIHYHRGYAAEFLCRCKYFEVEKIDINTERIREQASFQTDSTSFQTFVCVDGCGMISWEQTESFASSQQVFDSARKETALIRNDSHKISLPFYKGDTIFVPAQSLPFKIHGQSRFLRIRC